MLVFHILSLFWNCRHEKRGGGVGLYVHENLRYKRRPDLDIFCNCLESIFIEVYTKIRKCIIGVMYRPPYQNCHDFLEKLQSSLTLISQEKKECIIMGDFNINTLDKDNTNSHDFLNTFLSYSYVSQICKPTRIMNDSATAIDNIFFLQLCWKCFKVVHFKTGTVTKKYLLVCERDTFLEVHCTKLQRRKVHRVMK